MGLVFGGLRLCQRIFYGLQTARGCVVPRCVRFRWAKSGGKQPTGTEPRFRTPMFLKLNGAFDSHVFSSQAVKNNHPKSTIRKKYQQQLIQQTSANLRIRTNQQNPYHLNTVIWGGILTPYLWALLSFYRLRGLFP